MPLPQVAAASPAPAAARRRLFVSYSHGDLVEFGQHFIKYLRLLVRGNPALGYSEADIFFDRDQLRAGEDWGESIQAALETAGALIFLVSPNSLTSAFCLERELKEAVQRGIPVLPVILCDCPWEDQPLPGDPRGRSIGKLGALPKDENFSLRPVRKWSDPATAWNSVVTQLADALRKPVVEAPVAARPAANPVPPLLPYACNQNLARASFDRGVVGWSRSALLVFVKGRLEDRLPRFWDLLRDKTLAEFVLSRRKSRVLAQRALKWPSAWDGNRVTKDMALEVCCALSEALERNRFAIGDCAGLAAALTRQSEILPLMATLPDEPLKALSSSLRALLKLIESCPEGAPVDQLSIAFLVESEPLIAEKSLVKALQLGGFQRTHIVELAPLEALTPEDVRVWYRDEQLENFCSLDEQALVDQVFAGHSAALRFAPFEARLKPLLNL